MYGGNGRGKTTLCAILRSFQRNDPKLIQRRQTFKATSESEVGLLLDAGSARFTGGAWTSTPPDIHLFDQQVIAENVHGGDQGSDKSRGGTGCVSTYRGVGRL